MISSWIFDDFIICATIFLMPPTSALSFPLCVPHPPANCVNITHFHLIYQGILQRIFGMLSVKIWSFLTMLRCFCLLSRHCSLLMTCSFITIFFISHSYLFVKTVHFSFIPPKTTSENELIIFHHPLPQTLPERWLFSPSLIFVRYPLSRLKHDVISTH